MIDKMRNKINDLENTIYYYNSNSNFKQREKRTLSPSRSNFNTDDNSDAKYNSYDITNSEKKYNMDYREKNNSFINNNLEQENRTLKEELKKRDRIIINLENQMSDMKAVNKTCHELLSQLNV